MLLYVLRENLDVIGVIDTWTSLIWNTKFTMAGSFELYVKATPRNKQFLKANRFLARSDIAKMMYITSVEEKSEDNGRTLTVTGYSIEGILRKRMYPIWINDYKHGDSHTIPQTFASISPLGFKMNINAINSLYTGDVSIEDLKNDMETYVRFLLNREGDENGNFWQMSQTYSMEFDYNYPNEGVILVPILKNDYLHTRPSRMFSEDIGNIHNASYSYSEEGCSSAIIALVNTAANIVVQQEAKDEYGNTRYVQVNLGWGDLYNTEELMAYKSIAPDYLGANEEVIYVDPIVTTTHRIDPSKVKHPKFRPLTEDEIKKGTKYASEGQKEEYWSEDPETYTYYVMDQEATMTAMKEAIEEKILLATENVQGSVDIDNLTAYNIGEIVIIRDNDRLVDLYKRIEEIEETFDNSGYQINPTFGEPLKTIFDVNYRHINSFK